MFAYHSNSNKIDFCGIELERKSSKKCVVMLRLIRSYVKIESLVALCSNLSQSALLYLMCTARRKVCVESASSTRKPEQAC